MIIVTGGAGFIGSNIVARLAARGEADIVVVDRLRMGDKWKNIANHGILDCVHPDELPAFLNLNAAKIKTIFHMGAISATTEKDADLIFQSNFRLSMMLWDWAAKHQGVSFIYASSAATYGDGDLGFDDAEDMDHLLALRPMNAYGWSKALFDINAKRKVSAGQAPSHWAGLKFFNVYGPNEYHKGGQRSVAVQLFEQIRDTGEAVLFQSHNPSYEDGGQLRDFVYVDDCVDIMLWLMDHPEHSGLFNAGTGKARSFLDLAKACFAAMDAPETIRFRETPEAIRKHYQYFTEANMTKLRILGYDGQPTHLETGVERYIQGYLMAETPYR